jgi:succinylglutamic semialdehyde dehydrogenase
MSEHIIVGQRVSGEGAEHTVINPATGAEQDRFHAGTEAEAVRAIEAAREAFPNWAERPGRERIAVLEAFAEQVAAHRETLVALISAETGKPRWEAAAEVGAIIHKVPITIEAMRQRWPMEDVTPPGDGAGAETGPKGKAGRATVEATRYKPLGVLLVLGPFNLPEYLPNGHIAPALLAGSRVVWSGGRRASTPRLQRYIWPRSRRPPRSPTAAEYRAGRRRNRRGAGQPPGSRRGVDDR